MKGVIRTTGTIHYDERRDAAPYVCQLLLVYSCDQHYPALLLQCQSTLRQRRAYAIVCLLES